MQITFYDFLYETYRDWVEDGEEKGNTKIELGIWQEYGCLSNFALNQICHDECDYPKEYPLALASQLSYYISRWCIANMKTEAVRGMRYKVYASPNLSLSGLVLDLRKNLSQMLDTKQDLHLHAVINTLAHILALFGYTLHDAFERKISFWKESDDAFALKILGKNQS